MTAYGERVARELAIACAEAGHVVVSGLAQGIDSAAHRGAMDAGGKTVAVLGESISAAQRHEAWRQRELMKRIPKLGAIVSEFRTPFQATPWSFPKRNATIAALAHSVVVVEAGARSGALITARHARRLKRKLYAVPGPIGSLASVGTNRLIASGLAKALTSASDLVGGSAPTASPPDVVLDLLRDGPLGLDEIARRGRMTSVHVTARVAVLLLRGEVLSLPDGRLRRA